jgi:hypothetical protein
LPVLAKDFSECRTGFVHKTAQACKGLKRLFANSGCGVSLSGKFHRWIRGAEPFCTIAQPLFNTGGLTMHADRHSSSATAFAGWIVACLLGAALALLAPVAQDTGTVRRLLDCLF